MKKKQKNLNLNDNVLRKRKKKQTLKRRMEIRRKMLTKIEMVQRE
jgi:hypothetical protein